MRLWLACAMFAKVVDHLVLSLDDMTPLHCGLLNSLNRSMISSLFDGEDFV